MMRYPVKISARAWIAPVLWTVALMVTASPAFAQASLSTRAYSGLFGSTTDATARHKLDLTANLSEAYDDDLTADGGRGVTSPVAVQASGFYTQFTGAANYAWQARRVQFAATGASTLRYYGDVGSLSSVSSTAGAGFSAQLHKRTRLFFNQTVAYSPSYLYGLFPSVSSPAPGAVQPAAPDYAVSDFESYAYGTIATLSHGVSEKGTLTGTAEFHFTDYVRESLVRRDVKYRGFRGQFSQSLTRYTAFRVGYRYRSGNFGTLANGATTEHGVDVGVDYTKPLSATRRAVFSFSLGSSATEVPEPFVDQQPEPFVAQTVAGPQYGVVGDLAFGYHFGRTWQARASYRRGLEYIADLTQPVNTNGVAGVVEGLLSRNLDFAGAVAYSAGESAFQRAATAFNTYTGSLRLRYALTKAWALNAEYLYYYYDFGGAITLPPGQPRHLARNGVRAGVTFWIPVRHR